MGGRRSSCQTTYSYPRIATIALGRGQKRRPKGAGSYTYDEILARDKVSLDLFWLRDESLQDSASLPEPHVIAAQIADDLRAALEQIEDVLEDLKERASKKN